MERRCQLGWSWCDTLGRCLDPSFETECPSCDDAEKPLYCEVALECVATAEDCITACQQMPDYEWCPDQQLCMPLGQCQQIID